jgi:hypothetical protein
MNFTAHLSVCTPQVKSLREELTKAISTISPQFQHLPPKQQFMYLVHAEDTTINKAGLFGQFLCKILSLHRPP